MALDLFDLLGEKPPRVELKIAISDDPEVVSNYIRSLLKVDIKKQSGWTTFNEAYNEWRRALDTVGVLSFQTFESKLRLEEMRGFSISESPLPVIVINKEDYPAPRIFTLFHELAHILLGSDGICEYEKVDLIAAEERRAEVFCNHIAGAVLVPKADLLQTQQVLQIRHMDSIPDPAIKQLSKRYKTSREVILRRLLTFGYVSQGFYEKQKELYEEELKRRAKEEALKVGKKKIFAPFYLRIISSNGRNLTRLVLNTYYQEKISLSEVSDYLGIKLKHLPKIEKEMSKSFDNVQVG